MKIATVTLESVSPYSASRRLQTPKGDKEEYWDYEGRVWKERAHWTEDDHVFIPPMCFKRSLEAAAKRRRKRITGKGQSEYGKHFEAGVLVLEGLILPITKETLEYEDLYLSGCGRKGGMDVRKREPLVPSWKGEVTYHILDDIIPKDEFETCLVEAGNLIGIGRFRPEKAGYYGRYRIVKVQWTTK